MKKLFLIMFVWVLFKSGTKIEYKNANQFEWHDSYYTREFFGEKFYFPVKNGWLILLNNGAQVKCFDGSRIEDVGL